MTFMPHEPLTGPDRFAAELAAEPYRIYTELREAGPIHRLSIRSGLQAWVVTRYADVRTLLADPRLSVDPNTTTEDNRIAIGAGSPEERLALAGRHLLSTDPPDHTRLRSVLTASLTRRRIEVMRTPIQRYATELLDRLRPHGSADLLREYASPLAVCTICSLLGIPDADHHQFQQWGADLVDGTLEAAGTFDEVADRMGEYLVPFVFDRRRQPRDDLTSQLALAGNDGSLTDYELISMVYQLFFAGHETSAYAIVNCLLLTLQQDHRAWSDRDEALAALVEESLRFEGPIKVPTWRFATEPIQVAGTTIGAGEPVLLLLGGAARDPERFADPDEVRPDRPDQGHLAFSFGLHRCLGAALGRLEMHIAVDRALLGLPDLALDIPVPELTWRTNLMMRGLTALPTHWSVAS